MCKLFDHLKNHISLDSQYTDIKRIGRAENFKQFVNIVKFPHFFQPFSSQNTYQQKEKILQILNPFERGAVVAWLEQLGYGAECRRIA